VLLWIIQSLLMSGGDGIRFYLIKNIAIVGLQFLVVTINLKWLIPQFFTKRKFIIYAILSFIVVYFAFSISFFFIDLVFQVFLESTVSLNQGWYFPKNFWTILSGSSLYSVALLCSSLYQLIPLRQDKIQSPPTSAKEVIRLKEGSRTHILDVDEILYVKGLKEYVIWRTISQQIIVLGTLKKIEKLYAKEGLLRIHKSYIINTSKVTSYNSTSVLVEDNKIPIGRTYKKDIQEYLSRRLN